MAQEITLGPLWLLPSTGGHKGPFPTSPPLPLPQRGSPPLRVGHLGASYASIANGLHISTAPAPRRLSSLFKKLPVQASMLSLICYDRRRTLKPLSHLERAIYMDETDVCKEEKAYV
jgi:hypothetical protein